MFGCADAAIFKLLYLLEHATFGIVPCVFLTMMISPFCFELIY